MYTHMHTHIHMFYVHTHSQFQTQKYLRGLEEKDVDVTDFEDDNHSHFPFTFFSTGQYFSEKSLEFP